MLVVVKVRSEAMADEEGERAEERKAEEVSSRKRLAWWINGRIGDGVRLDWRQKVEI